jgi:putative endonuclease
MAKHNKLGVTGEAAAADFLLAKGYQILNRNFRYQRAEIDLIAQKEKLLVFAEVKTRSSEKFGYPEEFVSNRKTELFLLAAEEYIFQQNWQHDIRFDILAVTVSPSGNFQVHHIEDAFH